MTIAGEKKVQRQHRLPLSKAVEIAWKQIRMRLSRSLLVTSGIVLAIAFLIAIQINDALADGMRGWIAQANASPEFAELRAQRRAADERMAEARVTLRELPAADVPAPPAVDVTSLTGGVSLEALKKELGDLPADAKQLQAGIDASAAYRNRFKTWVADARAASGLRDQISGPASLTALLADNGVPTKADAVAATKLQTRWLLGLALLVAFVGILNAMLMSVTERFREIGTMKCLGALDSFIVKLFLIESLFQGVVGTVVGLILGVSISLLMNLATYGTAAFNNFQTGAMTFAVLTSAGVGVILTVCGAVWPAWQAARMHPIEAMRVEA